MGSTSSTPGGGRGAVVHLRSRENGQFLHSNADAGDGFSWGDERHPQHSWVLEWDTAGALVSGTTVFLRRSACGARSEAYLHSNMEEEEGAGMSWGGRERDVAWIIESGREGSADAISGTTTHAVHLRSMHFRDDEEHYMHSNSEEGDSVSWGERDDEYCWILYFDGGSVDEDEDEEEEDDDDDDDEEENPRRGSGAESLNVRLRGHGGASFLLSDGPEDSDLRWGDGASPAAEWAMLPIAASTSTGSSELVHLQRGSIARGGDEDESCFHSNADDGEGMSWGSAECTDAAWLVDWDAARDGNDARHGRYRVAYLRSRESGRYLCSADAHSGSAARRHRWSSERDITNAWDIFFVGTTADAGRGAGTGVAAVALPVAMAVPVIVVEAFPATVTVVPTVVYPPAPEPSAPPYDPAYDR